jgi:predicted dehydrogenase
MEKKELGIAVVGAGRIGSLRARLVAQHPSVGFLAVSDLDPERAETVRATVGADFASGDNYEVMRRPEVNAVIVSTSEAEHTLPILQALELDKPVLVEKPIALSLRDADEILDVLERSGGNLRVGYSRRFRHRFLRAKEQLVQGRLGEVVGAVGRVYNGRAQAFAILKRDPHATPVLDVLTYYVDLMNWFFEGTRPVEVIARGCRQEGVFRAAGYDIDDVTWAIVTYADGAVVNFGISYALPANYPSLGQSDRVEVLGTEGVMLLDDDHGFWGPLATETRAWLDHVATGQPCALATPQQARVTLETTIAIERAARTEQPVRLPLER